jgi:O-acetyl-ADP-ribose deacetylase (regulator of RNase III)
MPTPNVIKEQLFASGRRLQLAQGDITAETVDAIVNAANRHLAHGGGVAGAIAHRAGPQLWQDSQAWVREHGPVTHAEPAYTRAGDLPCRYVIHAVGPVWGEGDEDAKLAAAVHGSLRRAEELGLASIALPAISTGIFGFPKERAAEIILATVAAYFDQSPQGSLRLVRLVMFDAPTWAAFRQAWERRYP